MITCALIGLQTANGSSAQVCVYVGLLITFAAFFGNTIFSALNVVHRNKAVGNDKWRYEHFLFHALASVVVSLLFAAVCDLLRQSA